MWNNSLRCERVALSPPEDPECPECGEPMERDYFGETFCPECERRAREEEESE